MRRRTSDAGRIVKAISTSGLTIYDPIETGDPRLWIPSPELEVLLHRALRGVSLANLPLRTRSKTVKQRVCTALGYPIPATFRKTRPRFPGQLFDTYVQKSNNLQIWNEELSATRRYVLTRTSADEAIMGVKVVTGETLALLDTTGTLTQKYQARCIPRLATAELIVSEDTSRVRPVISARAIPMSTATPVDHPQPGKLLPIVILFRKLGKLRGVEFTSTGHDQERNRGAELHRLVCRALGYSSFQDDGSFPDVRHQLLEVKLTHLVLTTGEAFLRRFPLFGGKILNKKLQLPLPDDFFGR